MRVANLGKVVAKGNMGWWDAIIVNIGAYQDMEAVLISDIPGRLAIKAVAGAAIRAAGSRSNDEREESTDWKRKQDLGPDSSSKRQQRGGGRRLRWRQERPPVQWVRPCRQ